MFSVRSDPTSSARLLKWASSSYICCALKPRCANLAGLQAFIQAAQPIPKMADCATINPAAPLANEPSEDFSASDASETEAVKQTLTPELISGLVKQVRIALQLLASDLGAFSCSRPLSARLAALCG